MGPVSPTCEICLDLSPNYLPTTRWQFNVAESRLIESILHFSVSDLKSSSQICTFCSVVKDGLETLSRGVLQNELTALDERNGSFIVQNSSPLEVEILDDENNPASSVRIQLFFQDGNCNPNLGVLGTARNIAPLISSKSHCSLIQSWITHCLETHSACGQQPKSVLPTRLLDISPRLDSSIVLIETQDLAISSPTPIYATLSHCWGIEEFVKTTLSNVETFRRCINFVALPRTFQDAINIARELNIKYIWIDSLCIIQDSQGDWKHESALMASVYSNSYLNIAATASSESSQAFLAPRDTSHSSVSIPDKLNTRANDGANCSVMARASLNKVHKLFSTPSRNVRSTSPASGKNEAQLLSRAWVFQERHLAPRTLHFHHSELVLECRAGLRCECTGLDRFTSNPLRNFDDISFTSWYGVVEEFSRLRLTYQTDRLEALMGVAKVFWEKLGCSYLKGLWAEDMAKGLLWNVTRFGTHQAPCTTRKQGKEVAPTWSWASLVLAEGNRIFFSAGEDASFHSDDQFRFLGTDPPAESLHGEFRIESGAILVNCAFVDAIGGFVVGGSERKHDVMLIFQEDLDDIVLITSLSLDTDIDSEPDDHSADIAWDVSCLFVGSAEEKEVETDQQVTYHHMLVVQPSSEVPGSWERCGILNITQEAGIHRNLVEKVFRLV